MTAELARPFVLDNWLEDDLDYLGGPFAKGLCRQAATKEWLELSAAMPTLHVPVGKPLTGDVGYKTPPASLEQRIAQLLDIQVPTTTVPTPSGPGGYNHKRPRGREVSHDPLPGGKRAPDGGQIRIPHDTWHVSAGWVDDSSLSDGRLGRQSFEPERWSTAQLFCTMCRAEIPEDRDKYCSEGCARDGANALRRRNRKRKKTRLWPAGDGHWYVQRGNGFDLESVLVTGVGEWDTTVEEWNRSQPRNNPDLWLERDGAPYRDIFYLIPLHEDIARRRRSGSRPSPVSTIVKGTWQIGLVAPGDYLLSA